MKYERLGNLVKILSGFAFDSKQFSNEDGIPLVRIRDVVRGHSTTFYAGNYDNKYLIQNGDFLIGMDGEFNIAKWKGGDALLNQRVCKISPTSDYLDSKYLFRFLPKELKDIEDATPFVTVKHLSVKTLQEIQIPLPPLDEQKRIAEVLDCADALREKRRLALNKLDQLLQSVFLEMFGDPVKNPKGWETVFFDEVCKTRLGKMLDEKKQTGKNLRPYLRNANVQWNRFDLTSVFEMDFDEREREILRLEYGDLLICEGGEVGRTAIWKNELPECYYQKALHRGRPNLEKITPEFLMYLLWFFSKNNGFKNYVTSVTIAHLTGEKLKAIKIPLPPIELQNEFSEVVKKIESLKAKKQNALANVENLFQSIQQKAFQGELWK